MRVVTQNVHRASVSIQSKLIASIDRGLVWFVGFTLDDHPLRVDHMIEKLLTMRALPDDNGKTNYSIMDKNASLLVVPNFTLYGSIAEGRRPSFTAAMPPTQASVLFDHVKKTLLARWPNTQFGVFGEDMTVEVVNEGPFTMVHDHQDLL